MWQNQPNNSSYRESIKALEADIQHANNLAASLPRDYYGDSSVQMRLSYSPLAPFLMYLIEWMDCSCTDALPSFLGLHQILVYKVYVDGMPTMSSKEKKATLRDFYAVILPSLRQLEGNMIELKESNKQTRNLDILNRKRLDEKRKIVFDKDLDRDDECGICMEPGTTKMVLPTCGHSLCILCFNDWNSRSRSCPFCRGSLKRVNSNDLWVLTNNYEVVDSVTIAKENLIRFYLYIDRLPPVAPDTHIFVYDYMI